MPTARRHTIPRAARTYIRARQEYLEATFPATHIEPTKTAIASAAADDDKALDAKARRGQLVEPKLNVRNTVTKFLLDQTVGSTVNTLLFSMFMTSIQLAMAPGVPGGKTGAAAIDYGRVDWAFVLAKSRAEFWSIIKAGWRLWPAVSLVNFTLVKSVQGRNLLGSLAGVVWGIYMSLFAAA